MHGKLIEAIKEKFGISQNALAKELGFKKQFMSDIKNDRAKVPRDKWDVLIEKYNVEEIYLYTGKEPMFADEHKLRERDLLEKAAAIKSDWRQQLNLTDDEFELLIEQVVSNKEVMMLFFKALAGDSSSKEFVKKLLDNN